MKPIQELYRGFIERLRAMVDSQVNMSRVEFKTAKRYLTVICYRPVENDDAVYRVQYGHIGSNSRVLMHFSEPSILQKFVYAAIWKNPTYSVLRDAFKKYDMLEKAKRVRKAKKRCKVRQAREERGYFTDILADKQSKAAQTINIQVTKEHGGLLFVNDN